MVTESVPEHATPVTTRAETRLDERQTTSPSIIRMVVALVALVPFSLRSVTGWYLGYLVGLLPLRERTFTWLQLKVFLPEESTRRITPRVFANAGRTLLESINVRPFLKRSHGRITCDSWSAVQRWVVDSRPVVCLTAHTGNWDLLAAWVIAQGIPLTTIGREARKRSAQVVLRALREGYGIETIWRSDRSGLKRLIACLKERRVLAALIDQDTRVESICVPFFGAPAKTPVSLIDLGRKMNARFVTAFIFRTGWLRFSVFIEEIPDSSTSAQILTIYNERLETLIRRFPDQWVWFHKRWRSATDGITLSSREYERELRARVRPSSYQERGAGDRRLTCLWAALIAGVYGCSPLRATSLAERGEQLTEEKRYTEAIDAYRQHIEVRQLASARPEWENPHFYLLRIVDLELAASRPEEALKSCREAEAQGVERALVTDRYRAIATWHLEHGNLDPAFEILKQYRDRDPLIFDSMLDRVGRAMVERERPS